MNIEDYYCYTNTENILKDAQIFHILQIQAISIYLSYSHIIPIFSVSKLQYNSVSTFKISTTTQIKLWQHNIKQ